jgi:hypothetical protein
MAMYMGCLASTLKANSKGFTPKMIGQVVAKFC